MSGQVVRRGFVKLTYFWWWVIKTFLNVLAQDTDIAYSTFLPLSQTKKLKRGGERRTGYFDSTNEQEKVGELL